MRLSSLLLGSVLAIAGLSGPALAQDCKPSKWGAKDELGAANLVTPERVLAATKLVKQGKSQPLGIVIDSKTPAFPPRSLSLQVVQPNQQSGQRL
ncbi:MAG: cyclase family protein, partial [Reyranellaceae bacterium]